MPTQMVGPFVGLQCMAFTENGGQCRRYKYFVPEISAFALCCCECDRGPGAQFGSVMDAVVVVGEPAGRGCHDVTIQI